MSGGLTGNSPAAPFADDDLLPISALQHLVFCERQWALIHLEGQWVENRLTVQGRHLHERVHQDSRESRGSIRISRGLRLCSYRLGLTGQADVVEFHRAAEIEATDGQAAPPAEDEAAARTAVPLAGAEGLWQPFPVEYKRGKPKPDDCDEVQLCAQTLCLEEMLGVAIPAGALFYGQPRRRTDVCFDQPLRRRVEDLAARLHKLTLVRVTPAARYEKKCRNCSLIDICLPKMATGRRSARQYLSDLLTHLDEEPPTLP